MSAEVIKNQVGMAIMRPLPRHVSKMQKMIKMRIGMMKTGFNQRLLKMMKEKRVLEHRTPPTQLYVSTTQVTNEWAMSTIEDNSATPRDLSSVRAWMESSKYGEYEQSRNMINAPLAREKSTLKDGCNNAPRTGENVAHAQPNGSHEEDEIQNSNFEHVPSKRPSEDPEEDDRKPAAK